jgi:hypothetical protein
VKKSVGIVVALVAALSLSSSIASAASNAAPLTLSIQPGAVAANAPITFSGQYGDGVEGMSVFWTRWPNGTCSGSPDAAGFLTTTGGGGSYSLTDDDGLPVGVWSYRTSIGEDIQSSCATVTAGIAVAQPTAVPQVDHTFLCYSKWENDGGEVVLTDDAPGLIALGMWVPYAEAGNVPGGDNIGSYHLVCNPDPSLNPTGSYVDNNGAALDPGSAHASKPGNYPVLT